MAVSNVVHRRRVVVGIALDVVLPTAAYFVLRLLGMETVSALLGSAVVAGARIGFVAVRTRQLDVFGALVMAVYLLTAVTALIDGDQRVLLARDSVTTGVLSIGLLVSRAVGRPVFFAAAKQAAGPEGRAEWDRRWSREPAVRHTFSAMTLAWATVLLGEAVVRLPLIYLLPTDLAVVASSALQALTVAGLIVWTVRYVKKRRREYPAEVIERRA